jgi:peptide deformylase
MRIKIASVGEPVLRGAARPLLLEEIGSERIRELIAHMRETLADAPGVGLAAPQVGESLQLAIIEDKLEYQVNLTPAEIAERERRPIPFHVLINPEIELVSSPDVSFFEGCLSLPGFLASEGPGPGSQRDRPASAGRSRRLVCPHSATRD